MEEYANYIGCNPVTTVQQVACTAGAGRWEVLSPRGPLKTWSPPSPRAVPSRAASDGGAHRPAQH